MGINLNNSMMDKMISTPQIYWYVTESHISTPENVIEMTLERGQHYKTRIRMNCTDCYEIQTIISVIQDKMKQPAVEYTCGDISCLNMRTVSDALISQKMKNAFETSTMLENLALAGWIIASVLGGLSMVINILTNEREKNEKEYDQ